MRGASRSAERYARGEVDTTDRAKMHSPRPMLTHHNVRIGGASATPIGA